MIAFNFFYMQFILNNGSLRFQFLKLDAC